eukprot:3813173-Pleurochrysis_carterae.AAC.1
MYERDVIIPLHDNEKVAVYDFRKLLINLRPREHALHRFTEAVRRAAAAQWRRTLGTAQQERMLGGVAALLAAAA